MNRRFSQWSPAQAEAIVRFLDAMAEDIWLEHGDAINALRDQRARDQASSRSRRRKTAKDQISAVPRDR